MNQYFGLTFVIVTNTTNYNKTRSKITVSGNNYYYKVVFIILTILLLSLVVLTNSAHATDTSIYKSESKKDFLSGSMIKSYTANPHIRNPTTVIADSVITSHNLISPKAATTISPIQSSSVVSTLLTGSLSATHPKSNKENSFLLKILLTIFWWIQTVIMIHLKVKSL